ncbi:PKD domain-containing protein [Methanosarcina sp. Z-7115]|uniref:PKD domain-containing protein n=1 Tax=Methanosarcina baikalica TaxID=3073890 RepID=A0ABU2D5W8_9EURY|nr:PKD domain-containing protein [Methanosarcina sp. Z-7115]MDR7667257.1 PKD domain-containing protein [Methanosarcina sp. Z-7115]
MKKITCDETHRGCVLMKAFGIPVLVLLMLVSITGAVPFAYITNSANDTISVIDMATNNVTTTVPVGSGPGGVAVTPDGTKVYVANSNDGTVSVIDTGTITVISTVNIGTESGLTGVAVNSAGTKVYVVGNNGTVSVIDTATNNVTATVNVGSGSQGVAVDPDGLKVYVTNDGDGTVSVIDTTTNNVTATVNVGKYLSGGAANSAGTKGYIVNIVSNIISVIKMENNVTSTSNVAGQLVGVAVNPAGTKVYVANSNDGTVSVIDTATNNVTATVNVGSKPAGVAVNPAGTKLYMTNWYENGGGTVSVIDTTANNVTDTVNVGSKPAGVAVTPDGTKVCVANYGSNTVSVIDTATNTVTTTMKVEGGPCGVALNPAVEKPLFSVANFSSNVTSGIMPLTVSFTDTSTGSPTSWKWSFGDGNNSTDQNPVYTYSKIGKYTVKFSENNSAGISRVTKSKYITVTNGVVAPNANFIASFTDGKAPLGVTFTDTSTGSPSSWKWSFGDGNNSTDQNPANVYSKAGNYTVKLTVNNSAGSSMATKSKYINVLIPPVAAFSASPTKGKAPLTVTFKDKSKGSPSSGTWSFGDGNTSEAENPVNIYSKAGNYTVTLTATNAAGNNTTMKSEYIKVNKK